MAIFIAIQCSAACVSTLKTGSGAIFAITRWGRKDEWRLNPSGPREGANGQRGDSVYGWNYPTQAKTRLEWATQPMQPMLLGRRCAAFRSSSALFSIHLLYEPIERQTDEGFPYGNVKECSGTLSARHKYNSGVISSWMSRIVRIVVPHRPKWSAALCLAGTGSQFIRYNSVVFQVDNPVDSAPEK